MAKYVLTDPVIVFNGGTISQSCASVTISLEADDVETTAFGSEWRTRIGGLKAGTVDFEMHQDFGASGIDQLFFPNLGGTVAVAVRPGGTAAVSATNPSYSFDVLVTEYSPVDGAVGDLATTSVSLPITGPVTRGTTS
jgi:hypothetical protein